jgi:hypothetical protein
MGMILRIDDFRENALRLCGAYGGQQVLRLRMANASRSPYFAQDDKFILAAEL